MSTLRVQLACHAQLVVTKANNIRGKKKTASELFLPFIKFSSNIGPRRSRNQLPKYVASTSVVTRKCSVPQFFGFWLQTGNESKLTGDMVRLN
jgi:hypothetical protein